MYLIYIGWKSMHAQPRKIETEIEFVHANEISPMKALLSGIATNALNPKVTLFFLSLFMQFISARTPFGIHVMLGLETAIIIGSWFVFVAFMFSNKVLKMKLRKVGHWFERITGAALILLGVKVALSTKE